MVSRPDEYAEHQARQRAKQHDALRSISKALKEGSDSIIEATKRIKEQDGLVASHWSEIQWLERNKDKLDAENRSLQDRLTEAAEQFNEVGGRYAKALSQLEEVKAQRDGLLEACKLAYQYAPFHTGECQGIVSDPEKDSIFDETVGCTCFLKTIEDAIAACKQEVQS